MTTRNLDAVFEPKSLAIIGASDKHDSLGRLICENILASYTGPVYFVNPKYRRLFDQAVYRKIGDLPQPPDFAIIVSPAATVASIIRALAALGTRGVCVISSGFSKAGAGKEKLQHQALLDAAKPGLIRIVGPNSLGLQVPSLGLNAGFAHLLPQAGSIALVSQSGAIVTAVLDWAAPRGIGFSKVVSLGDMSDVDFGDMLDYLASDDSTKSILLYIEGIGQARKFISAARAAASSKPVVVIKAGRFEAGAKAVTSHTGALAGSDAVYDAVFRRTGMLRVTALEELFEAVQTLAFARLPESDRLAIVTNGGGIGVLAADALAAEGGQLAVFSEATIEALGSVLPAQCSRSNPVDILGDADAERYRQAIRAVASDASVDAILVMNCPTAVGSSGAAARSVIEQASADCAKPIFACWVGQQQASEARSLFRDRRIPSYETPASAVRAFMQTVSYRRNQGLLVQTPKSSRELLMTDRAKAQALVNTALQSGRQWLSAYESVQLLQAYGIPCAQTKFAATLDELALKAERLSGPLAIKIVSEQLTHKSDVGGVSLNVQTYHARTSAQRMWENIHKQFPDAQLHGFVIQEMAKTDDAHELIAGTATDAVFGPVIVFGQGGTAVEILNDKALALPPLNRTLARELIARTNVYRLLRGYRNVAPVAFAAIESVLVRLSQLVTEIPEILELDINPLLANSDGVLALDARVRVAHSDKPGSERLAIRPYPTELEQRVRDNCGHSYWLRPIVPEDESALRYAFGRLTPEEIRNRFFVPVHFLSHLTAARFCQIDYDRQMALVLTSREPAGEAPVLGVVRLFETPDRSEGEFAIILLHEYAGKGLGTKLMRRIIAYARARQLGQIVGDVLATNTRMLHLCRKLGFEICPDAKDPGLRRVVLGL